jgi:hypothetical protein
LRHRFHGVRVGKRNEVGKFGEFINNNHNHFFTLRLGKALDKIHGDVGPRHVRYWERV